MIEEEPIQPGPQDKLAFRTAYLIAGYIKENLTPREHEELDDWVTASMDNQLLFEELTDGKNLEKWLQWKEQLPTKQVLQRLKDQIEFTPPLRRSKLTRFIPYAVAASILIVIVTTVVFYQKLPVRTGENISEQIVTDLAPGGNRAILTLSDGSTVRLDSVKNGSLARQGNTNIVKQENGQLNYQEINSGIQPVSGAFNSLSTPKGGKYELILPDGTMVWLNAASLLRYPTSFSGNERSVELTGEGYFEVATSASRPFIVSTNGITVQVLGTHFNVTAYPDDTTINITLAEGSVKVNESVVLKPGQQAQVNRQGVIKKVVADLETTLAWKEGLFVFKNTPIDDVMRQVSRWYDASISYQTKPSEHFNVIISRDEPVSKLLHLLEQTQSVHFKIENKKITVMK